ncbi:DUF7260 family protein [Natronorubrum sulfidifaciens]|uniref:DUF7260 domain-containing protein n=1 Tax=Natronorubrum sulfidifaciens JCM 14089 TaxID=1230460 RepID=L9W6G3_9EURY|nr:hypothetical protein [Natronorubrum sulfidifaciens]ELY45065.1 hypothetical protein C495_08990 [Natronorubrum sulfidifaciens JCM 14089]
MRSAVLESATATLEREHTQLSDERRAFKRFRARVVGLETAPQPTAVESHAAGPQVSVRTCSTTPQPSGLESISNAYRETVVAVPHYDEVYAEPCHEHMAGELGAALAAAIEQESQFHASVKQSVLMATEHAVDARTQLIDAIEDERTELEAAGRTLDTLHADLESLRAQPLAQLEFNALRLTRARLEALRVRCDEFVAARQETIWRRRQLTIAESGLFERYCYGGCEWSYPVLAAFAAYGERLERTLSRVDGYVLTAK